VSHDSTGTLCFIEVRGFTIRSRLNDLIPLLLLRLARLALLPGLRLVRVLISDGACGY